MYDTHRGADISITICCKITGSCLEVMLVNIIMLNIAFCLSDMLRCT